MTDDDDTRNEMDDMANTIIQSLSDYFADYSAIYMATAFRRAAELLEWASREDKARRRYGHPN